MNPITLTAFTQAISRHINLNPELTNVWVIAELSDFRMHGPHAYGQLIEKDAGGRTVAKIQATIWGNVLTRIRNEFIAATGRDIATGMKLMLRVSASHSPAYGLSANISGIDPSYTLGDLERLRREILQRLQQEGILEANKRIPLPAAPQKIAIISAAGAAGYGDFINQITHSGFAFYPLLYQAAMQGDRTAPTVIKALDSIEMAPDFWDCVIIIRGGGATSDLNGFDNLELARRVALCPIPVIVGIGHERDNTVLDYIANTRCKTPTAVAAFLIDRLQGAENYAEDLARRIIERTQTVLSAEQRRIAHAAAMLPMIAPQRIGVEKHRLEMLQNSVGRLASAGISAADHRLAELGARISSGSSALISRRRAQLDAVPDTMAAAVANLMRLSHNRLESIERLIDVLSPVATLRRGYSITRVDGKAIRSAADVRPGTLIETTLPDGTINSQTL